MDHGTSGYLQFSLNQNGISRRPCGMAREDCSHDEGMSECVLQQPQYAGKCSE